MSYKLTIFTNITKPSTHPTDYIDELHKDITIPWQQTLATMANNSKASESMRKIADHNYNCMKTLHDKSATLADQHREKLMTMNRSGKRS